MNNILFTLLILLNSIIFSGCLYSNNSHIQNKKVDFSLLMSKMAYRLTKNIKKDTIKKSILINDFISMNNYKNNSALGFILSSNLKAHISKKNKFIIKEINVSKNIKINHNGITSLTRDVSKITNTNINIDYILVGQYQITSSQLILYSSIIDIHNSKLISATTSSISLSSEITNLEYNN
jgi:TolB-like protein